MNATMSDDFNPNSLDSMLTRVLSRLDEQDRTAEKTNADFLLVLSEIRTEAQKTNGRVTKLERWRDVVTAKTSIIAAGLSLCVTLALKKFLP